MSQKNSTPDIETSLTKELANFKKAIEFVNRTGANAQSTIDRLSKIEKRQQNLIEKIDTASENQQFAETIDKLLQEHNNFSESIKDLLANQEKINAQWKQGEKQQLRLINQFSEGVSKVDAMAINLNQKMDAISALDEKRQTEIRTLSEQLIALKQKNLIRMTIFVMILLALSIFQFYCVTQAKG